MSNLFNDLMDDWDVYLICRGQRERFIGSRRLEEKDVNCHNCSRLNNTNKLSSKISLEFINSSDYPVLVLIQLDRLEILIVFFFFNSLLRCHNPATRSFMVIERSSRLSLSFRFPAPLIVVICTRLMT